MIYNDFFFMVDGFCFRFFKIISSKSNKSWPFVLNKTTLITIQKLIIYISRKKINRLFLSPLSKIFFLWLHWSKSYLNSMFFFWWILYDMSIIPQIIYQSIIDPLITFPLCYYININYRATSALYQEGKTFWRVSFHSSINKNLLIWISYQKVIF